MCRPEYAFAVTEGANHFIQTKAERFADARPGLDNFDTIVDRLDLDIVFENGILQSCSCSGRDLTPDMLCVDAYVAAHLLRRHRQACLALGADSSEAQELEPHMEAQHKLCIELHEVGWDVDGFVDAWRGGDWQDLFTAHYSDFRGPRQQAISLAFVVSFQIEIDIVDTLGSGARDVITALVDSATRAKMSFSELDELLKQLKPLFKNCVDKAISALRR